LADFLRRRRYKLRDGRRRSATDGVCTGLASDKSHGGLGNLRHTRARSAIVV